MDTREGTREDGHSITVIVTAIVRSRSLSLSHKPGVQPAVSICNVAGLEKYGVVLQGYEL